MGVHLFLHILGRCCQDIIQQLQCHSMRVLLRYRITHEPQLVVVSQGGFRQSCYQQVRDNAVGLRHGCLEFIVCTGAFVNFALGGW